VDRRILVFLLLGFVSLFADIAYEGARSVVGAYIRLLGAVALGAGLVTLGELVGYGLRLASGVLVGLTRSSRLLWGLVAFGYGLNAVAVPMLAYARSWNDVVALVVLERFGKAIRAPARDVVLAEVSKGIGYGKGFGIHELLDQVGAVAGPLILAFAANVLGYRKAFLVLAVPATMALILVLVANRLYPRLEAFEYKRFERTSLGIEFWLLVAGLGVASMGFLHWSIVSYHIENLGLVPYEAIATLYAIAMLSDAIVALPMGMLYDAWGPRIVVAIPLIAMPIPILLTQRSLYTLIIVAILWGAFMSSLETVARASIATIVPPNARPYAYGIYSFVQGVSMFLGGLIAGTLYTPSLEIVAIVFPCLCILSALILLLAFYTSRRVASSGSV